MNNLVKHIAVASAVSLMAIGSAGAVSAQSKDNNVQRLKKSGSSIPTGMSGDVTKMIGSTSTSAASGIRSLIGWVTDWP